VTGKNRRVHIDYDSPEPRYRQLIDIIVGRIECGTYEPGRLIPSLEQIRGETGLSLMTIRKATGILRDEGWIRIVPGKGTYVNPPELWPQDE